MLESLKPLIEYKFDKRFTWILIAMSFILIGFHIYAFLYFLSALPEQKVEADKFMKASDTISGITSSTILVLLIVLGYKSIYNYNERRRKDLYASIEKQIKEWFNEVNLMNSVKYIVSNDKLRHFKVSGDYKALCSENKNMKEIKAFCENIHYELTHYPTELIYGIHFEFDNKKINSLICKKFMEIINIRETLPSFTIDKEIPKKRGWIFLIKKIELSGDLDKDIAVIATHARHFVELVCHTFQLLYCLGMLNMYIKLYKSKKR